MRLESKLARLDVEHWLNEQGARAFGGAFSYTRLLERGEDVPNDSGKGLKAARRFGLVMCDDDYEVDSDDGDYDEGAGSGNGGARTIARLEFPGRVPAQGHAPTPSMAVRTGVVVQPVDSLTTRTAPVTALTPWHPPAFRVVPNEMLRCALFRVANPARPRAPYRAYPLRVQAARDGVIEYTGWELRQDDRQVFLELLFIEQQCPGQVIFRPRVVCDALGWGRSNTALIHLRDCLSRLASAALVFKRIPRLKVAELSVSLLHTYREDQGVVTVELNNAVRTLFAGQHYTKIACAYHDQLKKRSYLASWLLGYLASHREPLATTVAALQLLCGDDETQPKEFKRKLGDALAQLQAVGFLVSYAALARGQDQVQVVRA